MPVCGTIVSIRPPFSPPVPTPSLLRISRPRFWPYELGTYVLGAAAATAFDSQMLLAFFVFAAYFLFPANLLIYGINDIHDYDTDRNNPKKQGYEALLEPRWHRFVLGRVIEWNLPVVAFFPWLSPATLAALVAFAFCAIFYSAPPIRAKARPFFDSLFSAGHYVATGIFGYLLVSGEYSPDWQMVVAGMAWCMAMHAYSAVPDIRSDREAGLSTIATKLGDKATLILCAVLYGSAALLSWPVLSWGAAVAGVAYLVGVCAAWGRDEEDLLRVYRFFPLINALVGASITLFLLFRSPFSIL